MAMFNSKLLVYQRVSILVSMWVVFGLFGHPLPSTGFFPCPYSIIASGWVYHIVRHIQKSTVIPVVQWKFQDPKMEVLYHIRPYFAGDIPLHKPYIGLIYGRYLQFRFLKWPLSSVGHISDEIPLDIIKFTSA